MKLIRLIISKLIISKLIISGILISECKMGEEMKLIELLIMSGIIMIIISGCIMGGRYRYTDNARMGGGREIKVWISEEFKEEEREEIRKGIGEWNYGLNGRIEIKIEDEGFKEEGEKVAKQVREGGWIIRRIGSGDKRIPKAEGKGLWVIGFVEGIKGQHMYLIWDRLPRDVIKGVVMHEIGHLLGVGHIGHRLMSGEYGKEGSSCIDYETMWAVAEAQDISMEGLNFCADL